MTAGKLLSPQTTLHRKARCQQQNTTSQQQNTSRNSKFKSETKCLCLDSCPDFMISQTQLGVLSMLTHLLPKISRAVHHSHNMEGENVARIAMTTARIPVVFCADETSDVASTSLFPPIFSSASSSSVVVVGGSPQAVNPVQMA